jgi:hypothetical protein
MEMMDGWIEYMDALPGSKKVQVSEAEPGR